MDINQTARSDKAFFNNGLTDRKKYVLISQCTVILPNLTFKKWGHFNFALGIAKYKSTPNASRIFRNPVRNS